MKTNEQLNRVQPILDRIPEKWGKYCDIGEGWYDLVLDLNDAIAEIDPDYVVHQCKEQFGGLRYYTDTFVKEGLPQEDKERIFGLIYEAENRSFTICDLCGKPAELRTDRPWVRTLCDDHQQTGGSGSYTTTQ